MQNSPPRENKISRWLGVALACGYFVLCIVGTKSAPASWNDISRVAAIESLSERGKWSIDDSEWKDQTQDKVFLNGKFYSDKMPLLSWMAAGTYTLLSRLGFSLAPNCARCAYYPLTLIFVGLPASILIFLFFDFAFRQTQSVFDANARPDAGVPKTLEVSSANDKRKNRSGLAALIGTCAFGLATMILPYSLVFNHHVPAAVSLFAAFYLFTTRAKSNERWLSGVGFFAVLAIAFDPLALMFAGALFVTCALRFRLRVSYFLIGAMIPVVLTAWLDYQTAGTLIPPYLIPSGYAYEGSAFPATIGGNGTPDDVPQYAFKMFVGAQGLFAYNPLLFFALAGCIIVAITRTHSLRVEAIVIGLASLALGFYLATRTGNLGGNAYGERYFVNALPIVMAFIFFAPPLKNFQNRFARALTIPLFAIALGISVFSSYQGAQHPWQYVPPPAHPTRNAETGALGWKWEARLPLW